MTARDRSHPADRLAVNVAEAAQLLSVPERTVWTEIGAGRLRSFKVGKHRRIRIRDIDAYLGQCVDLAALEYAPARATR